jgi:hypothetical protein
VGESQLLRGLQLTATPVLNNFDVYTRWCGAAGVSNTRRHYPEYFASTSQADAERDGIMRRVGFLRESAQLSYSALLNMSRCSGIATKQLAEDRSTFDNVRTIGTPCHNHNYFRVARLTSQE